MPQTLCTRTYLKSKLPGVEALAVRTALNDDHDGGAPWLVADLCISFRNGGGCANIEINLTAPQMRELASPLSQHAERIDNELQPFQAQLAADQVKAA